MMSRPGRKVFLDGRPCESLTEAAQRIGCTEAAVSAALRRASEGVGYVLGHAVSLVPADPAPEVRSLPAVTAARVANATLLAPGYRVHRIGVYHGQRV